MTTMVMCKALFWLVAVHCVTCAVGALQSCPDGWEHFLDSCYLFSHEAGTFGEGEQYCEHNGGYLVHINDAGEEEYIISILRERQKHQNDNHWIGLTDNDKEMEWRWTDNHEVANYTDWSPGEPNQGPHVNCAAMRSEYHYMWTDDICHYHTFFAICEKRAEIASIIG